MPFPIHQGATPGGSGGGLSEETQHGGLVDCRARAGDHGEGGEWGCDDAGGKEAEVPGEPPEEADAARTSTRMRVRR